MSPSALLGVTAALLASAAAAAAPPPPPSVAVFAATGGGFAAAIAAARAGAAVTLIGATGGGGTGRHIGGMVTGGLQHTDCGNASVIGGIAREFFVRVETQYPGRSTSPNLQPCSGPPCWLFEAHVAEHVMYDMLAEANVTVVVGQEGVASVELSGGRVTRVTTLAGATFAADVWVDASYEGDLLAAAGATMAVGREGSAQYGEAGAGVRELIAYDQLPHGLDPYFPGGQQLIPLITTPGPGFAPVGSPDNKTEAYTYRLCMTRAPSRRVAVARPAGYNATTYELFRRYLAVAPSSSLGTFLACLGPIPNDAPDCPVDTNATRRWCKCDMIGGGALGTDLPGASWAWATASVPTRRAIAAAHADYVAGLVWFLGNDPSVPSALRAEALEYGLCADEFTDTQPPHFPHQLYVREARRLVGDFVLTQNTPPPLVRNRTIGLGSYAFDAHTVQRGVAVAATLAGGGGSTLHVVNEGELVGQPPAYQPPYRIPFDTLLPARAELENLLAAVAVSASHVAFTSLRMEPTWMIMGHAAGRAAAMAAGAGGPPSAVQDVDVPVLQRALVLEGQLIYEG